MKEEITMHTVVCDNCGKHLESDSNCAWTDELSARTIAMEANWIEHNDKDYCDDCWQYDDDDNIKIKSFINPI